MDSLQKRFGKLVSVMVIRRRMTMGRFSTRKAIPSESIILHNC